MSSENASRKKRNTAEPVPAPDGDHRKRRRNRTTQSCLNCHTSKRMCDRKRPACARCTQLGLTGLCVYEVDDPNQRTETQDESSRLLKRVAELEGVIRELKNKPHPRWVQATNSGEDLQSRLQIGSDECSSNAPSPPVSSSSSDRGDSSPGRSTSAHSPALPKSFRRGCPISIHPQPSAEPQQRSSYGTNSPVNTPSPPLMTPTDEYPFSHVGIVSQGPPQDYDLASMFLSYPGLVGVNDGNFLPVNDIRPNKFHGSQCGCLNDPTSYNTMLELSLRLRKATDVLGQSPSHRLGGFCHLHQRISELDSFTINALSDISTSPNGIIDSVQESFHQPQIYSHRISPASRGLPANARPWDMLSSSANSPASLDDPFMTWEPRRS
ncbi:hypothetical protein GALMADRAFT_156783 [Galerina marginata CBS 339.88]|uniref:Zn(2)-C6 fungal-type domain-containing protein n=1 Tax=Galerina marginata (strain CBS 339.88) TaxID=685588 RepID=A0A067TA20_GALM3|nr:hypothetical protein GALMADRAFT_156783 [Galerina marginata CBS 339.88]